MPKPTTPGAAAAIAPIALGIADAARAIAISESELRRRVIRGEVRHGRIGKRILIPVIELERLAGLTPAKSDR